MRINEELILRAWCDYRGEEYIEGRAESYAIPSENFVQGFKSVYKLPLEDRLTEEERERVRVLYFLDAQVRSNLLEEGMITPAERGILITCDSVASTYINIFGSALFEEKPSDE